MSQFRYLLGMLILAPAFVHAPSGHPFFLPHEDCKATSRVQMGAICPELAPYG